MAGRTRIGADGRMFCADCGSTWVEVSAKPAAGRQTSVTWLDLGDAWNRIRDVAYSVLRPAALLALTGLTFAAATWLLAGQSGSQLTITDAIQIERDGRIAVRVKGIITNSTSRPLPLGPVEIVLMQNEDHRFYRWTYTPGLRELAPGKVIRFTTADGSIPRLASRVEIGHSGVTSARNL